jgi:signal transduction histidine kinase
MRCFFNHKLIGFIFLVILGSHNYGHLYAQNHTGIELSEKEKKERFAEVYNKCNFDHVDSALNCSQELLDLAKELNYKDGIIKACRELGYSYTTKSMLDSARHYIHLGLKLSSENHKKLMQGELYETMARTFRKEMRADSMRYYLTLAKNIAEENAYQKLLSGVHNEYANYYSNTAQNDSALYHYLIALEIHEKHNDSLNIATSLANIGKIYVTEEDYDDALRVLRKSNNILRRIGKTNIIPNNLNNMGVVYDRRQQFDSALIVYKEAHRLKKETANTASLAISFFNLGSLSISMENYQEAAQYIDSSMQICENMGIEPGFAYNYSGLGELYFKQKEYDKAIEYLIKGIDKAQKFKLNDVVNENMQTLAVTYYETGQYKLAYETLDRYVELRDSIRTLDAEERINILQTRFNSKQKENKILQQQVALQNKESAIQKAKLQKQRFQIIIATGIIIIIIIAFFYFRSRHHIKKLREQSMIIQHKNEELKKLNDFRTNMISTMVHDLKTPLNTVIGLSDLGPDSEGIKYIHKAGHNMLTLVNNILDVQKQEEVGLKAVFETLDPQHVIKAAVRDLKNEVELKNQTVKVSSDNTKVRADEQLVHRVMINLLGNAIKYSPDDSVIHVNSKYLPDKKMVEFSICDQGRGIESERIDEVFEKFSTDNDSALTYSSGIGLYFCKLAVNRMEGDIGVENIGEGLKAWFTLKPELKEPESSTTDQ